MDEFVVSVIIPAYSAEKHLRTAVEAAVHQDEVGEVIIIEDCSPDNTLEVCVQLEREYDKVRLLQHPDKKNHGCGASRNLGLKNAKYSYITFADADNYLLPNRYEIDKEIFEKDPEIEGVYHAEGVHYYTETSKELFRNTVNHELITFSDYVEPADVFNVLIGNHKVTGSWGVDSLTIKKSLLEKTGGFNTNLKLQQDVDLFIKMAALGKFRAGDILDPRSIRGVHDNMRSTDMVMQRKYRTERWKSLKAWFNKHPHISPDKKILFKRKYDDYLIRTKPKHVAFFIFLKRLFVNPKQIAGKYGFFDQTFFLLFGRNWFTLHSISFKNRFLFKN